jgi:hypothetical protein
MMMMTKKVIRSLAIGLATLGISASAAQAAPKSGVARSSVTTAGPRAGSHPVMVRQAGPGNIVRGDRLFSLMRDRHKLAEPTKLEEKDGRLRVEGPGWTMRISDGGNNFRFRKDRAANVKPVALSSRPSKAKVLSDALAVINGDLSEFVTLGSAEQLVELGVRYESLGGQAPGAAPDPTTVGGWVGIFGRSVNGNLIVGGGSHVAVVFDSAGGVEAVDVDWPSYSNIGQTSKAASMDVVRGRAKLLEHPLTASQSRAEARMECGYFDPSGRHGRSRILYLQLGCVRQLKTESTNLTQGNSEHWAESQAIPASESPLYDFAWAPIVTECNNPNGCK